MSCLDNINSDSKEHQGFFQYHLITFQEITIKSLKMCNETVKEQVFKNNTFLCKSKG